MFDPKQLIFVKNTKKLIASKPVKYNKNADTRLLLLLCTKSQREKKKSKNHSLRVQALKKR